MTNPERSVDEIVEEFQMKYLDVWATGVEPTLHVTDWLTQTLQTERKKRDEMVEAERERLLKLFSHKEYIKRNDLVDALTQPNNPN